MTTEEILKEMDALEERAAKLREEIIAEEDFLKAKPIIDELEQVTSRMFELHQKNQAVILENLFEELQEYFGL